MQDIYHGTHFQCHFLVVCIRIAVASALTDRYSEQYHCRVLPDSFHFVIDSIVSYRFISTYIQFTVVI